MDVTWRIEPADGQPWLNLEWVEREGPPVVEPQRRGFGSRLIGRGLAAQLGGEAEIKYVTTGVVCHIRAPIAKLMIPLSPEAIL